MTPPDSGDLPMCADPDCGFPHKPDSGEREVCKVCVREMARNSDWGQLVPDSLCWASISKSLGAECWQLGYERLAAGVSLPLPLAQRILAALESRGDMAERYALRDELRAIVERKTPDQRKGQP